ncbi:hypothetical protein ATZ33_03410 [Enterococcus silesiacus]|uniref:Lipoprotein n=1 Tax=Enterococcus silesiacus TaxID=332949 RepID=A0A0S3K872_9ENTE|nr:hypothetical protein [Enterococcus silesiacus]ALS00451.1 hypothetical protein ATZ33_03410 [Enterococcus silesiacus]OJG90176.1 hypothetical protein RV15_GL001440 [Enterococcus silesiacus]
MKRSILLLLFCLFMLTGCKIEYNSPQSARDDNYGVGASSSYSSASSGDDKTSGTRLSKTGTGDEVITNLAFKKGPVIIALTHAGNDAFIVKLLDSDGKTVATLVDKVGSYSGKVVAQIPKDADNYLIAIKTDGTWCVESAKADKNGE